jgi:prevent-host-death family protein
MGTVGIRELKNRLTHYVRLARQGDEVIVTERGTPVAILRSIEHAEPPRSPMARLARLAARGSVVLPTGKPRRRFRPVKIAGPPLSQAVIEDRR